MLGFSLSPSYKYNTLDVPKPLSRNRGSTCQVEDAGEADEADEAGGAAIKTWQGNHTVLLQAAD